MDKNELANKIQDSLKESLKGTKWSTFDVVYDPIDLGPIVTIMEETESGKRLRFQVKISDVSEIVGKENKNK